MEVRQATDGQPIIYWSESEVRCHYAVSETADASYDWGLPSNLKLKEAPKLFNSEARAADRPTSRVLDYKWDRMFEVDFHSDSRKGVLRMTEGTAEADAEMRTFCEGVGGLVLWASAIDAQLTKAVIRACTLTETPMLEPIVAELGAGAKVEILRARSKHIKTVAWSTGITRWANKVEKVNGYRNTVAHHQVVVEGEKLVLYSAQARKLLKRIKDLKPAPAKTVDDINQWVEAARDAYEQGQKVLANLDRLAEAAAKGQAK